MAKFQGAARPTFPSRSFDRFLADQSNSLRLDGAPARKSFKDLADTNLILTIGRRGAGFYFKGMTPTDEAGHRKDLMIMIGKATGGDGLSIAEARKRCEEIREDLVGGRMVSGIRAKRAAARAAAEGKDAEIKRREEIINAIAKAGSRPSAGDFATLAFAKVDQCVEAYALHGFDLRKVTESRRDDVLVQLRLAFKEAGAGSIRPGELDGLTLDHAFRSLTNSTARKRISAIRGLYRWLIKYKAATENPADTCEKISPPQPRTRFANAEELQAIWRCCEQLPQARSDFIKLLTLLPLRRDELAEAKISDIQTSNGYLQISIPKVRSKTKTEHRLPIVGEAANIVRRLMHNRDQDSFLIPLAGESGRFDSWTSFKKQIQKLSGQNWYYFHSARKCFSTECVEHELEEDLIIDGALNHAASLSIQGSAKSYNFAKAMPRRADLLSNWCRTVLFAVEHGQWPRHATAEARDVESNVISLVGAVK
jgi:integrase